MTVADPGEVAALREQLGGVVVPRDVVLVDGPEAADYLQGQLSQDVAALGEGGSAWSFLLQPSGRIDALVAVARLAGDAFALATDAGWGERVVDRLARFKLRTKCDVAPADGWACVSLRGPFSAHANATGGSEPLATVASDWPGNPGRDLLGPGVTIPSGVAVAGLAAYDLVRISCGVPANGRELTEDTIPAEAGDWLIGAAVSFTKGCYTGQELVARIDSRGGNVPRPLRVVTVPGAVPPVGAEVLAADGSVAGSLTSVAAEPSGGAVALGRLARKLEPGAATVRWDGGEAASVVAAAPSR